MVGVAPPFPLAADLGVSLACCKVGLDRPLTPAAFVANLFRSARVSRLRHSAFRSAPVSRPRRSAFRSARVSRPRRSADRRSPGNWPTVGDGGFRGRASPDTVPEPAWRLQPQVTAMGQSNPLPRSRTGNGASVVRGLVSIRPGSEELGMIARFWPEACATRLQHAAPFGAWLQGPGVNLQCGRGDETVEDVLRNE